jgi:catechol 2,3-dioxygenase-like lactoylglutathione lyase family enzyme
MKIKLNNVFVGNQDRALKFYTEVLGFVKKVDMPVGNYRWLTVISPESPDDVDSVLEPNDNPAVNTFQKALFEQGIPLIAFEVDNIQLEFERLKKMGVVFLTEPTKMGETIPAVFDDTCVNLIQIYQV